MIETGKPVSGTGIQDAIIGRLIPAESRFHLPLIAPDMERNAIVGHKIHGVLIQLAFNQLNAHGDIVAKDGNAVGREGNTHCSDFLSF